MEVRFLAWAMAPRCSWSMTVIQTTSSASDVQALLFAVMLLLLLLLVSAFFLRLQGANRMLQERIINLDKDMAWWEKRCGWYEYERRYRSWDVRISSSLTDNVAWTVLHIPHWGLGWCRSACPICKRPLELTVWDANFQGRTHESGVPAQDVQQSMRISH